MINKNKRIVSFMLAILMIFPILSTFFTTNVKADGGSGSGTVGGGTVRKIYKYYEWDDEYINGEPKRGYDEESLSNWENFLENKYGKMTSEYKSIWRSSAREALEDARKRSDTNRARIVGIVFADVNPNNEKELNSAKTSKLFNDNFGRPNPSDFGEGSISAWSTRYNNSDLNKQWNDWLYEYGRDKAIANANINANGMLTLVVYAVAEDEPIARTVELTITKQDAFSGNNITGKEAQFSIWWDSKATMPVEIKAGNLTNGSYTYTYSKGSGRNIVYTNTDTGKFVLKGLPQGSVIYLKEENPPRGYKLREDIVKVDLRVSNSLTQQRTISNERAYLQILKVDELGKLITNDRTGFEIYKDKALTQKVYFKLVDDGRYEYVSDTKTSDNKADVWTGNDKRLGYLLLDNLPNIEDGEKIDYYVKEIKAPFGYELKDNSVGVIVYNYTDSKVTLTNKQLTWNLEKVDKDNVRIVSSQTDFTIQKADDNSYAHFNGNGGNYTFTQFSDSKRVITTEKNKGIAVFEKLPEGEYIITEIKAPSGYRLDTTPKKVIVKNGETYKFVNEESTKIQLIKSSTNEEFVKGNPNYSLEGAEYGLYNSRSDAVLDKNKRATFITDENGKTNVVETLNDRDGYTNNPSVGSTYFVREIKAPKGYELDRVSGQLHDGTVDVTITKEGLNTFKVKDKPKGDPMNLMLRKTNEKGLPLSGAEYEVRYYEEITNSIDGLTPKYEWVFKTGENGSFRLDEFSNARGGRISGDLLPKIDGQPYLPMGTLYIKEIKAPKGYALDKNEYIRVLREDPNDVEGVLSYNEPEIVEKSQKMKFTLLKMDITNENIDPKNLQGAEYSLKVVEVPEGQENVKVGDVVRTVTIDKDGKAFVDNLEVATYDVIETKPADGYQINPVAVRVKGEFENNGKEYTSKVSQISTNKREIASLLKSKIDELNKENSNIDVVVDDGIYYPIEDDNITVVTNEMREYGRFTIHKTSGENIENSNQSDTNKVEKGIEFLVRDINGEIVETLVTDENGNAYSNYYPYNTKLKVSQVTEQSDKYKVDDFEVTIGKEFSNQIFEKVNEIVTRPLQILKKDSETGKLIAKSGVVFEIYENNGGVLGKKIEHFNEDKEVIPFETNEEGVINLPGQLKVGKYFLKEIKAPEGYFLDPNGKAIEFEITKQSDDKTDNQVIVTVEVENKPQKGEIVLEKIGLQLVDVKEENGVTTPIFEEQRLAKTTWRLTAKEDIISEDTKTLLHKKGDVIAEVTTTKDNPTKIENLAHGKYLLQEISTPKEYVLDSKVYEIEFDGVSQSIRVESKTFRNINERKNLTFELEKDFEMSKNFTTNPSAEFGLFLAEDYTENGVTIKKDSMIDKITVKAEDGKVKEEEIEIPVIKEQEKEITRWELTTYKQKEVDDKDRPIVIDGKIQGYEKKIVKDIIDKFKFNTLEQLEDKKKELDNTNILYDVEEFNETITIPVETTETEIKKVITRLVKGSFKTQLIDGNFYVKELSTDKNYILDDENHSINFDFEQTDKKANTVITKSKNNLQRVNVKIVKVEMGSNNEIAVEGARYELIAVDDQMGETKVGEYVTNEKGEIEINNLENRIYYIREIDSPDGYFINEERVDIDLSNLKDGETFEQIVEDERKPEIKTNATDKESGKKNINPISTIKIKDKVLYKDLIVGKEYVVKGKLMDKTLNTPLLDKNKKEITSTLTFIPKQRNGYVELIFELDASLLRGKEVVVFEKLYREDRLVAVHEDINDLSQTVKITNPNIKTKLSTINGEKKVKDNYKVMLVDSVKYNDLIIGEEYTLELTLMDKLTNKPVIIDGKIAKVKHTFIADKTSGIEEVLIDVDLSEYKGREIVAFEKLFYKGEEIAKHEDINDKEQTIKIEEKPREIPNPETGDNEMFLSVFMGITSLIVLYVVSSKKRKEIK